MEPDAQTRLRTAIASSDLPCYVYSYPSKRAYRPIEPARSLAEVWSDAAGSLNLYIHIPFCGYRCSFCTLFLTTAHSPDLVQAYVDALVRQIAMYGALLGQRSVISLYIGGGTPTTLRPAQFEAIFAALHAAFPSWHPAEVSVEGSPDTMSRELLACLKRLGVNRISMGLQTLDAEEQRRVGRPYEPRVVLDAVEAIDAVGFENVNYDLIYGLDGQRRETWFDSLATTVGFAPKTITLYPVVVRPLTAIQKRLRQDASQFMPDRTKYALYDESVDFLAGRGYHQDSFVRFTTLGHDGLQQEAADFAGVPLLGLGAGARSYTDTTHYSTEFAVRRSATLDIIHGFVDHDHRRDEMLDLGFVLDDDEQRRRYCILNLSLGTLDPTGYAARFGGATLDDFAAELDALAREDCARADAAGVWHLTRKGYKYSNVIGTLLKSSRVDALERAYVAT